MQTLIGLDIYSFKPGGIRNIKSVVDINNIEYTDILVHCIVPCVKGDIFYLTATMSNTYSAFRAYSWLDSEYNLLGGYSAANVNAENQLLTATNDNTAFLIVNSYSNTNFNITKHTKSIEDRINNLENKNINDYTYQNFINTEQIDIIKFEAGAIENSVSIIDPTNIVKKDSNIHAIVKCNPKDKFLITGNGDNGNTRLYGWATSEWGNAGGYAGANMIKDNAILTAPNNASYLIFNALISQNFSLYKLRNYAKPGYVPNYITNYDSAIISARNDIIEAGQNGITFVFSTDQHWESNPKTSPGIIKRIFYELPIKRLFIGGDMIDGGHDKATSISILAEVYSAYKNSAPETYYIDGNHDTNTVGQTSNKEAHIKLKELIEICKVPNECIFADLDSTLRIPYYFDDVKEKNRYIIIDTYIEGIALYPTQIAWINQILSSTPAGYTVIIFAHIWYQAGDDEFGLEPASQGSQIINIADEFNTNSTDAKIIALIGGHVHRDAQYVTNSGINLILTSCDSLNRSNAIEHTLTETCIDIITINKGNNTINCRRIGVGEDRQFTINI